MDHTDTTTDRRTLLKTTGAALSAGVALGTGPRRIRGQSAEASITFEDQAVEDGSVVVAAISTEIDARFVLRTTEGERQEVGGPIQFGAGETAEDFEVELSPLPEQSQEISANLYDRETGENIARVLAEVFVDESAERRDGVEKTFVAADSAAGFEYPYYLYAPSVPENEDPKPVVMEPTNSGQTTDDFAVQRRDAESKLESGLGRDVADGVGAAYVVPVLPRPRTEPVDWTHYVHSLDDTTMAIEDGPLERVDLQVLRMVEDARERLAAQSYPTADGLLLTGFSASGNFVDRFTMLHPDRVLSVTAGGLNGMPILPLEEADGHTLPYHVGIADVEDLTGSPVDLDALGGVNQFLFMGAEDTNDTIPYDDAWTDDDLRQTALDVYGDHMIEERFPRAQAAYEEAGVDAQFRVYEDTGHNPAPAIGDMVAFHEATIAGEDVGEFGDTIRTVLGFDATPEPPAAGESVELDASASEGGTRDLEYFLWDFGNGDTAVGETVTYTFEEAGAWPVTLTTVSTKGTESEVTETVVVANEDGSIPEDVEATTETETETETAATTEASDTTSASGGAGDGDDVNDEESESGASSPGFGVGGALAGLAGASYLLGSRDGSDDGDDEA
jgi:PGF-CTERM protein